MRPPAVGFSMSNVSVSVTRATKTIGHKEHEDLFSEHQVSPRTKQKHTLCSLWLSSLWLLVFVATRKRSSEGQSVHEAADRCTRDATADTPPQASVLGTASAPRPLRRRAA